MSANRVEITTTEKVEDLFTPEFTQLIEALHDRFKPRIDHLRATRMKVLNQALKHGVMPSHLSTSQINTTPWIVPPVPEELSKPGIEITGPASMTSMFINAINPGSDGDRAEGDLDDDEDASGHRFIHTIIATRNRLAAVERTLEFTNKISGRHYSIKKGELPFFMHRERGLHLDESAVKIDGNPICAAILGTALTIFYAGRAQAQRNQGIYFYLPKLESAEEAGFWREFFDYIRDYLQLSESTIIRAVILVESLPLIYQMEEALYALGPYAAGLNAARWDLKASILEYVMTDTNAVWPDRFNIDIKTTDFLANIFRRLVAICLKHGAIPIGGMATALPSNNMEVNQVAASMIAQDKEWEANQGFIRAWVAHIFHMETAATPFKTLNQSGWRPSPEQRDPSNYPIEIKVPDGPITIEGTRRNVRMVIEYLEGWLRGRGAKGIDSLAGQPGIHPALMEDLATGRISVAQIAQRIRHKIKDTKTGHTHNFALVKRILHEEVEDIISKFDHVSPNNKSNIDTSTYILEARYRKSVKIAARWIKNYTELDYRSLGSYSVEDLDSITNDEDPF